MTFNLRLWLEIVCSTADANDFCVYVLFIVFNMSVIVGDYALSNTGPCESRTHTEVTACD